MTLIHDSLSRVLSGSVIRGTMSARCSIDTGANGTGVMFEFRIKRLVNQPGSHEWSFELFSPANSGGQTVFGNVTIRWAGSLPIISLHEFEWPGEETIERAEVLLHNRLFAGIWRRADETGHVLGVIYPDRRSMEPTVSYVIERSGEALRQWWTGEGWSDQTDEALWYAHEPNAARETNDEGAHAVYYPNGRVAVG